QPREPGIAVALLERGAVADRDPRAPRSRDLDREVDVGAWVEARVHLEELGDRLDVVARDPERLPPPTRGEGGNPGPLPSRELGGRLVAEALRTAEDEPAREQMALQRELL